MQLDIAKVSLTGAHQANFVLIFCVDASTAGAVSTAGAPPACTAGGSTGISSTGAGNKAGVGRSKGYTGEVSTPLQGA